MKKFLVIIAVLALTVISSVAMAEVTVSGGIQIRSRDFTDLTLDKNLPAGAPAAGNSNHVNGSQVDTQERVVLDVNAKFDNVKGKISIWNDFDDWGRFENVQGNNSFGTSTASNGGHFGIREAWMSFNLPSLPVNVTGGHQLLQLGNGWFFRSKHFGSDAWVVAMPSGKNTLAFVDVKISEGLGGVLPPTAATSSNVAANDDTDAYVLLDVFKINDNNTLGFDITMARDRRNALGFVTNTAQTAAVVGNTEAENLSLNYNGKLGPLALKAQVDFQTGKSKPTDGVSPDRKLKGNEIVLEGTLNASDKLAVNILLARGSGRKSGEADYKQFVTFLDIDPHYTFLYEYKVATAAGGKNSGFSNTTAVGVGAMLAATKSLKVGGDLYYLQATEKCNVTQTGFAKGALSDKIGTEVDLKLNWQLYDNLSWNWVAGYFKAGDAYKDVNGHGADAAKGIQGVLAFSF